MTIMAIKFDAIDLTFYAEVDYYPETEDDNEYLEFRTLTCTIGNKVFDAMVLAFSSIEQEIYEAACKAAEKDLKHHNEQMKLDADIANYEQRDLYP